MKTYERTLAKVVENKSSNDKDSKENPSWKNATDSAIAINSDAYLRIKRVLLLSQYCVLTRGNYNKTKCELMATVLAHAIAREMSYLFDTYRLRAELTTDLMTTDEYY
jgi:hypothetical protein